MDSFTLDGVKFVLDKRAGKDRGKSKKNEFILVKNDRCLNYYKDWTGPKPKEIMEVGMFEGGSLVYLDKLFKPKTIIGLDIRREPIKSLEEYAKSNDNMKTYYARSQDKPGTLMAARQNFPKGIDLVVDDASHLYEQTKATFEMLFPLVKKGGRYIIEDWAWAHLKQRQGKDDVWYEKTAMSNLILQIVVAAAAYPVIDKVEVFREMVVVHKGAGMLPKDGLDLSSVLRGREMPLL